jgi:hypothetical protein
MNDIAGDEGALEHDDAVPTEQAERKARGRRLDQRFEIYEALLLAAAAVLTAWAAYQNTKFGGDQAENYAAASAARTESTRASTRAGQLTSIDVTTFTAWTSAVASEAQAKGSSGTGSSTAYQPQPGTLSGFLYERFRPEFKVAVDSWILTKPLTNPDAPPTPFAMADYKLADQARADQLAAEADALNAQANHDNDIGDRYVLMMILFASVLFFAGISSKMDTLRARLLLLGCGLALFVAAAVITMSFPKQL